MNPVLVPAHLRMLRRIAHERFVVIEHPGCAPAVGRMDGETFHDVGINSAALRALRKAHAVQWPAGDGPRPLSLTPEGQEAIGQSTPPPTCPFHSDRAQVRNGMCGECAEKADDAL